MSSRKIRVRFAPSPTGPLHMGGVRTALYNYLFAKKQGGDFILRIEDTDQNRFVKGAEEYIIESLKWCGIEPNEGIGFGNGPHAPYRQSERKELYRKHVEELIAKGKAYYAFDSAEDLDIIRKQWEAEKKTFAYDSSTRLNMKNSLTLDALKVKDLISSGASYVVRLLVPENEEIHVQDIIRGEVNVNSSLIDDKVLFKSDGMPTYHLANVVDDYLMQITHVIRGEEWLPSAPLHVLLYRSFGWESVMPQFAHLPLLLKPEGNGKLSKRDGDRLGFPVFPLEWKDPESGEVSSGYREKGYYPEAFINMLALLGWHASGDKELFTMEELIQDFTLERVHKAGAKFDPEKAKWFNEHYLRLKSDKVLAAHLKKIAADEFGLKGDDHRLKDEFLLNAVRLLKERVQFEHEMAEKGVYLFMAPADYDRPLIEKKWKPTHGGFFQALLNSLSGMSGFSAAEVESVFKETAAAQGVKPGEVLQLLRVFVSGQGGGVDLFGMLSLLGKEEVLERLEKAMSTAVSV
ncbi:MAG: glutamate--tRNA ligase [Bacteroidetes bacterium]|nr:MAG: glutamate--tRNA ligase [Bacteroidota bacterium]REK00592.1 MAG: glutamate--tRNA ligase [Bacteroidota bacterium]REK35286.1 MAG: glutamate--tRNA ligase [Bacteroidota bacterium]REK48362.1 MAG: glutamate--tRNA ligase [Bacteroidota bacterium]